MDRAKEISKLTKQIRPMMDRFGTLSVEELTNLGKLSSRWMQLSQERSREIEKNVNKANEYIVSLESQIEEYEVAIEIVNAFVLERGIAEELAGFADEMMEEFQKSKGQLQ